MTQSEAMEFCEQFFSSAHLPPHLREISEPFGLLARQVVATLQPSRERDKALDRLLEAKDAAVRSRLAELNTTPAPGAPR